MKQADGALKDVGQHPQRRCIPYPEAYFGHLDVPVAVVSPEELIYGQLGFTQLKRLQVSVDGADGLVQAMKDPPILSGAIRGHPLPALLLGF